MTGYQETWTDEELAQWFVGTEPYEFRDALKRERMLRKESEHARQAAEERVAELERDRESLKIALEHETAALHDALDAKEQAEAKLRKAERRLRIIDDNLRPIRDSVVAGKRPALTSSDAIWHFDCVLTMTKEDH